MHLSLIKVQKCFYFESYTHSVVYSHNPPDWPLVVVEQSSDGGSTARSGFRLARHQGYFNFSFCFSAAEWHFEELETKKLSSWTAGSSIYWRSSPHQTCKTSPAVLRGGSQTAGIGRSDITIIYVFLLKF